MRFSLPAIVAFLAAETSSAGHLRQGPEARAEDRKLQAKGGVGIGMEGKGYTDKGGDKATYGARPLVTPLAALGKDQQTDIVTLTKECYGREAACCAELAEARWGTVKQVFQHTHGCELALPANSVSALSGDPKVAAAEPNALVWASEVTWGLDRVDQTVLPLSGTFEKAEADGTRVFILDTGVQLSHNEFADNVGPNSCHANTSGDGDDRDCHGHGTHVASTACGHEYGVAKNCELCSVKVLTCSGSGSTTGVIAGINFAVGQCLVKPCVANMSLGGGFSQALNNAVASAHDEGVVMVVAAGNESVDACSKSPASEPKAITVGSTTSADAISSFSNTGTCVDVYDPGSSITGAWIGSDTATNTISGTSMASPHVAGIAAGVIAGGFASGSDPADVADFIVETADRKGDLTCTSCSPAVGLKGLATFYPRGPTPPPTPPPPTPPPTPCTATSGVVVSVTTDNYPQETSWDVKKGEEIIESFDAFTANTLHEKELCLNVGEYVFTIYDEWGDGICCGYGRGAYSVTVNGETVKDGAEFGASESTAFEVSGDPAPPTPPPVNLPTTVAPTKAPTNSPTKAPTGAPTKTPTKAPTTAPTFFSCAQYSEASCTDDKGCQWTGTCHNCGCVPLPRQL